MIRKAVIATTVAVLATIAGLVPAAANAATPARTTVTPAVVHIAKPGTFYACIGFAVNGQPAFISSKFTTNVAAARDCQSLQGLQSIQKPTLLLRYKPMLVSQS